MPKWKPGVFGPGPRVPMDRERRAVFKAKLLLQCRPGRLTIATATIGRVLVDMLGPDGTLCPSLATIAGRARVSVATVKRSLVQLRECGFVHWTRRLVRCAVGGWRTEQGPNAWPRTFAMAARAAATGATALPPSLRLKDPPMPDPRRYPYSLEETVIFDGQDSRLDLREAEARGDIG
jgi:hypothetical protein